MHCALAMNVWRREKSCGNKGCGGFLRRPLAASGTQESAQNRLPKEVTKCQIQERSPYRTSSVCAISGGSKPEGRRVSAFLVDRAGTK
jgi:hypothetical protein